jgi:hypothetical protein
MTNVHWVEGFEADRGAAAPGAAQAAEGGADRFVRAALAQAALDELFALGGKEKVEKKDEDADEADEEEDEDDEDEEEEDDDWEDRDGD